jgi:hypothetical protein
MLRKSLIPSNGRSLNLQQFWQKYNFTKYRGAYFDDILKEYSIIFV